MEDSAKDTSIPKTMKAVGLKKPTKPEELQVTDGWPVPTLKDTEILIKVHAFGLNFADVSARKGQYDDAPPFPFIPGYEASGVVVQIGKDVKNFQIGDRVFALTDFGGYGSYCKSREDATAKLPNDWEFAQGAAILVVFVTAYHSLFNTGLLQPGDRVLIHACAGGLGLASLQLALHAKCEVFGTCGSDEKVELIKKKGVHHAINYTTQQYADEVKKITNGQGVDVILDAVGGSNFKKDLSILRPNGRCVGLGASAFNDRSITRAGSLVTGVFSMLTLSSIDLMLGSKSFVGVNLKRLADNKPQIVVAALTELLKLFQSGALTLDPPTTYPWEKIGEAHQLLESRKTTGKLVMLVSHDN
jgi:NADPH2:quinone reductase